MSYSPEDVVRQLHKAFASGDYGAFGQFLDERIVCHVPGNHPLGGVYRGTEAVVMLCRQASAHQRQHPLTSTHLSQSTSAEHIAMRTLRQATIQGQRVEWHQTTLYFLRQGKVATCWVFVDNLKALDLYWSLVPHPADHPGGESPSPATTDFPLL